MWVDIFLIIYPPGKPCYRDSREEKDVVGRRVLGIKPQGNTGTFRQKTIYRYISATREMTIVFNINKKKTIVFNAPQI